MFTPHQQRLLGDFARQLDFITLRTYQAPWQDVVAGFENALVPASVDPESSAAGMMRRWRSQRILGQLLSSADVPEEEVIRRFGELRESGFSGNDSRISLSLVYSRWLNANGRNDVARDVLEKLGNFIESGEHSLPERSVVELRARIAEDLEAL